MENCRNLPVNKILKKREREGKDEEKEIKIKRIGIKRQK